MKFAISSSIAIFVLQFLASTQLTEAAPPHSGPVTGRTIALRSPNEYCLFLPPMFGGGISESESSAVAFCNRPLTSAPDARTLPRGFIKSLHFVQNDRKKYVQITGRIDRSKYGLSRHDSGGLYDEHAPEGARCAGYKHFVEMVEPDTQVYCLRCCQNEADCPVEGSMGGCRSMVRGDYS
ncbi:hypothetical protein BC939DRAFT_456589 [Gamsiella multidivaricata]|uniref:uncharacterized protein n=1 Tax=Gamsiella multidivaricata TaxID=101098 RepID=UPI00221E65FB|nr:uncharacterized protein BC939DRAFT_456585 [Gamsiella multidivaricata]XP_051410466.1 uncharacterized protein BC939DRAFT_456589 [Gamsiella multidivaricata]KAI7820925.1 hypothetical protein BC939DRAFT_456585 [Gamsiella multidivaricata]KAI7820927.1 hypothetical protein BC939DRAFT_456589 [Gamsiella multidivaricata]